MACHCQCSTFNADKLIEEALEEKRGIVMGGERKDS